MLVASPRHLLRNPSSLRALIRPHQPAVVASRRACSSQQHRSEARASSSNSNAPDSLWSDSDQEHTSTSTPEPAASTGGKQAAGMRKHNPVLVAINESVRGASPLHACMHACMHACIWLHEIMHELLFSCLPIRRRSGWSPQHAASSSSFTTTPLSCGAFSGLLYAHLSTRSVGLPVPVEPCTARPSTLVPDEASPLPPSPGLSLPPHPQALKRLINEQRPLHARKADPGMPSSHATSERAARLLGAAEAVLSSQPRRDLLLCLFALAGLAFLATYSAAALVMSADPSSSGRVLLSRDGLAAQAIVLGSLFLVRCRCSGMWDVGRQA
jgi:hypothetical protein